MESVNHPQLQRMLSGLPIALDKSNGDSRLGHLRAYFILNAARIVRDQPLLAQSHDLASRPLTGFACPSTSGALLEISNELTVNLRSSLHAKERLQGHLALFLEALARSKSITGCHPPTCFSSVARRDCTGLGLQVDPRQSTTI